jgi:hypothetical protein
VNLKLYVFTGSQTGAIIGGVAGGLIGVILLLLLLAAVIYFRAKQGKYILCFLSSPDPKGHESCCHHFVPKSSPSINFYISDNLSFTFRSVYLLNNHYIVQYL